MQAETVTELEKTIYNKHLAVSRSIKNKPFKIKKDFSDIVGTDKHKFLKRLSTLFKKHSDINFDVFFQAPYRLYPDVEYIFRPINLGVVDNFQDMLSKVDTEYVLFIGADNWLRSDAIELLSNANTDIVTYDIVVTGELKDHYTIYVEPAFVINKDASLYGRLQYAHADMTLTGATGSN